MIFLGHNNTGTNNSKTKKVFQGMAQEKDEFCLRFC